MSPVTRTVHVLRQRPIVLVILPFAIACAATLSSNWGVTHAMLSSPVAGTAAFCLTWGALFPLVRRRGLQAGRRHWLRGIFIVVALWLLMLVSG